MTELTKRNKIVQGITKAKHEITKAKHRMTNFPKNNASDVK